mmetsp:Transcript_78345/g.229631  ORF Transcript_78345/g.229631 Transcript_78345/m.229631 type:complete len:296 (+) Transcript_78345:580-1467(+)
MGIRVEETILENLVAMHLKQQPGQTRPVQGHRHLLLGPLRGSVAARAHASAYKLSSKVAHSHRCHEQEGLLFTHLPHVHCCLDGLILHVYLGGILLVHLLFELFRGGPVHLCEHLEQRQRVLPDGGAHQPLHREHLASAERPRPPRAGGVPVVERHGDADLGPEVRHHVIGHLPHDGRLLRVVELRRELVLHGLEDLLDLLAHAYQLHGERHGVHVHLEEPLHLRVLHLHGDLRAVVERGEVHLPDGRRRHGLLLEVQEDVLELAPELRLNYALDHIEGLLRALVQKHRERIIKL